MTGPEAATWPNAGFGVYVHFPWCLSKCGYCDFYSIATRDGTAIEHDRYADAIIAELAGRLECLAPPRLTSVYFGGGTPSLWRTDALSRVLQGILSTCGARADQLEITVECNPSSFDRRRADELAAAGVNRISLGIQSLDPSMLQFLGRRHDREQALTALDIAIEAGIPRVSADMLFGLPEQSLSSELAQLVEVASRPLSHVSAYALTIEQDTPFGRLARRGKLPLATEDRVAEAFIAVDETLERLGYDHYEISNFARPGQQSLHNVQYWRGLPYLGLGVAAFGTLEIDGQWLRYRNPTDIPTYLGRPFGDGFSGNSVEPLDPETRLRERIMLGLRLADGIDLEAIGRELDVEPYTPERTKSLERLSIAGRIAREHTRLWIPREAWLLADGTIAQLI